MRIPSPRGPLSQWCADTLRGGGEAPPAPVRSVDGWGMPDPLTDEDAQLALWILHEMHYAGFSDADAALEWDPVLLTVRRALERRLEAVLRERTHAAVESAAAECDDVADAIFTLCARDDSPGPLARLQRSPDIGRLRELLVHRSVYQLKEADPQTWMLPRLRGRAKTVLLEIQYDEYGSARVEDVHQQLFADTLAACGLDAGYGAYVDQAPASTLAISNTVSMLCLHRRLLGAAAGHFAAVEATSSLPSRKTATLMRRLGLGPQATRFFDEHVEADAVHEQLAARELCGSLVADSPGLRSEVLFGAAACLLVEGVFASSVLDAWEHGRSSLYQRAPVGDGLADSVRVTA
ncbi:MAG: iron-containing redox enzyme family protein [Actinomycetota bacterium]|nr:iron-containing redox enzyme family protein [Actinomycetota bacterium]